MIIADEPTTALDVTIQAQILDVLKTAKEATGAAIVLITHDLGVVAGFADRVAVMYAARIVEIGDVDDVFYRPRMPYTLGLLGSIPRLDVGRRQRAHADRWKPAIARAPAVWMPVLAAMPAAHREMSGAGARAAADSGTRSLAPRGVSPQRRNRTAEDDEP